MKNRRAKVQCAQTCARRKERAWCAAGARYGAFRKRARAGGRKGKKAWRKGALLFAHAARSIQAAGNSRQRIGR